LRGDARCAQAGFLTFRTAWRLGRGALQQDGGAGRGQLVRELCAASIGGAGDEHDVLPCCSSAVHHRAGAVRIGGMMGLD
jgi:hypothetical protein